MRGALIGVALVLLPVASAGAQGPTRARAGAAVCGVSEPVAIGTSAVRNLRAELAVGADGRGLVVWAVGESELQARPISAGTAGTLGPVVRVDHGIGLDAVAATGRGFVAVSTGSMCTDSGSACLRAVALGHDGASLGPAYEPTPEDQWSGLAAHVALPDGIAVAYSPRWSSAIHIFRIAGDGSIAPEPHPLRADCSGDSPIQALASDRGSVVAFGSSCEAPESQRFVLALGNRRQPIYAIPAEARVERFTSDGGVATVVFRAGRLRPRLLRVAVADGAVVEGPIVLSSGSLPADLADVVVPELVTQRGRLVLRRTDVAGTAIGQPADVAPARGRVLSRLVWGGDRFYVLRATRTGSSWSIELRSVSCAEA